MDFLVRIYGLCNLSDRKKLMTDKDFEAFKQAWKDYPSQDNEGYLPDRAGFKCGWFAALAWERSHSSYEEGVKAVIEKLESKEAGDYWLDIAVNQIPTRSAMVYWLREKFGAKE